MNADLVPNPATGEYVNLKESADSALAAFIMDIKALRVELSAAEARVSSELVDRMDRSAIWTLHLNGFEVKAPSPTAGTDEYPPDALETVLWDLIESDTITAAAAAGALKRGLTIVCAVDFNSDPGEIARALEDGIDIKIAGHPVTIVSAEPFRQPVARGIAALRKVPGAAAVLDKVKITRDPGPRKATVKAKA